MKDIMTTPAYLIDESKLISNLEILSQLEKDTGCHVLLAQKAYSIFQTYPLINKYISGTTASGLYEAKLGYETMGSENHVFSPAYKETEFDEILSICDHIIFNSMSQWVKYKNKAIKSGKKFGLRINPEYSTQEKPIYDPCAFGSRFGVKKNEIIKMNLDGISGLHFHTLCEQNSDDLERTMEVVEKNFGEILLNMEWINLGGGHHITRDDYDIEKLKKIIHHLSNDYGLKVYLEPGEAIVLNAGYMISGILDIVDNGIKTAILDTSAACHMPDIIEMPYTPKAIVLKNNNEYNHVKKIFDMEQSKQINSDYIYRFGGNTCLAGDVFGDYEFEEPLCIGDRVIFLDMALYTMVKNNTFNGTPLPSILLRDSNENIKLIKEFSYLDFKSRL